MNKVDIVDDLNFDYQNKKQLKLTKIEQDIDVTINNSDNRKFNTNNINNNINNKSLIKDIFNLLCSPFYFVFKKNIEIIKKLNMKEKEIELHNMKVYKKRRYISSRAKLNSSNNEIL